VGGAYEPMTFFCHPRSLSDSIGLVWEIVDDADRAQRQARMAIQARVGINVDRSRTGVALPIDSPNLYDWPDSSGPRRK
jgi:hypothetical protein